MALAITAAVQSIQDQLGDTGRVILRPSGTEPLIRVTLEGVDEGRFKSCIVQENRYLLTCLRYIELNPVRAGLVRDIQLHRV